MRGDNLPVIVLGVLASAAACVGLVMWARPKSASSPASPEVRPAGLFPGLQVGTVVLVDPVAALMPPSNLPAVTCQVDMLLSDPALVSVRALTTDFKGTIPRAAIIRVLEVPAPGDFA